MLPGTVAAQTAEDELGSWLIYNVNEAFVRRGRAVQHFVLTRWVDEAGTTDFRNRFRYRLQVTTPINRQSLGPRIHFFNCYDELFLNYGNRSETFDQNRLYAAYGRQFTAQANLQLGLLWQHRSSGDFLRLQVFYTHSF